VPAYERGPTTNLPTSAALFIFFFGGRFIAGTGTISPDGTVGAIGGIRQKLAGARAAGAELFLMPKVHCGEAAGYVPDGLRVVPVETLTDAVLAIEAWKVGSTVPSCPV
jgi:PDZ domain-containing protein